MSGSARLRVLAEVDHGLATCAYCPKLCRFSCPVAEVEKRETVTPWGKVTMAFYVARGHRDADAALAETSYACSGCLRCRTFCKHGQEVADLLARGRAAADLAGATPAPVAEMAQRFASFGNQHGQDLSAAAAALGPAAAPGEPALFPGCTHLESGSRSPAALQTVARALGTPLRRSRLASACCGYPLWAAGRLEAFAAHARSLRDALAKEGAGPLVCSDPGCAYTFNVLWPRYGVPAPAALHATTWLAPLAAKAPARPPLGERLAYHDPCLLGRGLGEYEAPRKLLAAAGVTVAEPEWTREEAGCSGGGGLLPLTRPETAAAMARARAEELLREAPRAATACPTAAARLSRAGAPAEDVVEIFARWLGQR